MPHSLLAHMPAIDKLVIWPLYFDSDRSRSQGRMVSSAEGVSYPSLDDVIAAAIRSGFDPEVERDKRHPKTWHESAGRILLPKKEPKSLVLKKIAKNLKGKRK
jgi:signal recognition particle subunit SRP19